MAMTPFEFAVVWHGMNRHTSPTAKTVQYTQAILEEVNEAVEIIRQYHRQGVQSRDSLEFAERHRNAPYGRG